MSRKINVDEGCLLLALSGHSSLHRTCPLSGVKRTWLFALHMSAYDPKRTSVNDGTMRALTWPRAVALRKELQSLVHSVEAHEA